MEIKISQNKKEWDEFLIQNEGNFFQSWDFGSVQEKEGKKIWRFEIFEKRRKIAQAQVQKEHFPFGKNLFYIGYGPCFLKNAFLKDKKNTLLNLIKALKKLAKKENVIFLNIEATENLPSIQSFKESKRRVLPQKTIVLSLKEDLDTIFKKFHSKTRYNIRLAEKRGVEIDSIQNIQEKLKFLEVFWKNLKETAKRGKFKTLSKDHFKNLFFQENTILYLAKKENKIIAGNLMLYFGKRVYYLHGFSNYKYRNLMAPHLLHWRQICQAKEEGFEEYDFWGIDEKKWPGITRFKRSFGGKEVVYPAGVDFVFDKFWYLIYLFLKKFS